MHLSRKSCVLNWRFLTVMQPHCITVQLDPGSGGRRERGDRGRRGRWGAQERASSRQGCDMTTQWVVASVVEGGGRTTDHASAAIAYQATMHRVALP